MPREVTGGILLLETFTVCKLKASTIQRVGPHSSVKVQSSQHLQSIHDSVRNFAVTSLFYVEHP